MPDYLPEPVVLVADDVGSGGHSPSIPLGPGTWEIAIYGGTFDAGNSVQLQFAGDDVEARYASIKRPPDAVDVYAVVANEEPIIYQTAGGFIRLYTPTLGTNSGVTLVARYVCPN